MTRKNKTRDGAVVQKKGVCVAVIPFVEADILVDGSVYVELPKRSAITRIYVNTKVPSGTSSANISVYVNGNIVVSNFLATSIRFIQASLISTATYLETGGDIVIKAGSIPPATGSLVADLIVEYVEFDKNTGEYTTFLDS